MKATRTVAIEDLEFIVAPTTEPVQLPVEKPQPRPRTYCPDCGPQPGAGTCTPSRQQFTGGVIARRCKKHAHCSQCGKKLPKDKRYICLDCESWNMYGA